MRPQAAWEVTYTTLNILRGASLVGPYSDNCLGGDCLAACRGVWERD